jgi:hypothetical protein
MRPPARRKKEGALQGSAEVAGTPGAIAQHLNVRGRAIDEGVKERFALLRGGERGSSDDAGARVGAQTEAEQVRPMRGVVIRGGVRGTNHAGHRVQEEGRFEFPSVHSWEQAIVTGGRRNSPYRPATSPAIRQAINVSVDNGR